MDKQLVDFSGLDELFMQVNTSRHAQNAHIEVRAKGRLDANHMRAAIRQALLKHPMACARIAQYGSLDLVLKWEILQSPRDPLVVVEAGSDEAVNAARDQFLSMEPDLFHAPPMMVWLVRHPGGDSLIFNMHHASVDGIGAMRFVQSVTRAYAGEDDDTSAADPLEVRNNRGIPHSPKKSTGEKIQQMMDLAKAGSGKATAIAAQNPGDLPGYTCYLRMLDAKELAAINCRRYIDATFNDLLLAAMHRTVDIWNKDRGVKGGKIRVPAPVNLRGGDWAREVYGNYFMSFNTNTQPADRTDPEILMKCIARQTRLAKEKKFAEAMYAQMWQPKRIPTAIKGQMLRVFGDMQTTSAFVSNLGRLPEKLSFGADGDVAEVWVSAPVPMPVGMALGAISYAGRLHLTFRYCNELMDSQAGEQFVKLYLDAMRWLG